MQKTDIRSTSIPTLLLVYDQKFIACEQQACITGSPENDFIDVLYLLFIVGQEPKYLCDEPVDSPANLFSVAQPKIYPSLSLA